MDHDGLGQFFQLRTFISLTRTLVRRIESVRQEFERESEYYASMRKNKDMMKLLFSLSAYVEELMPRAESVAAFPH